jgi:O-acetylhomoserine (thiol)-lyase
MVGLGVLHTQRPGDSAQKRKTMADSWKFETQQIHAGATADPATKARATPIYRTTAYVFDNAEHAANLFALAEFGNIYTRIMNPTQDVAEKRIAALEGGTGALLLASGQAATTTAILNITQAGDHIVSSSSVYGGTYNLFKYTLPKIGIEVTFVEDQDDLTAWEAAIRPNTKAFFAESIANPRINILDIEGVSGVAHAHDLPLIVDNTVASPYLIKPLEHGADIVVHSATKFLGGHGTVIAGAIVDGGRFPWSQHVKKFPGLTEPDPSYHGASYTGVLGDAIAYIIKARVQLLRDLGSAVSPDNAFGLIQGIETLSLRMERHCENALAVAHWLEANDHVANVNYAALPSSPWYQAAQKYTPQGSGAVLSFEIKGGVNAGRALVDSVELFSHVANIGDVRSLIIHPASTTHSQLTPEQQLTAGVTPGLVRLSVGLEHIDDILADLAAGFAAAQKLRS